MRTLAVLLLLYVSFPLFAQSVLTLEKSSGLHALDLMPHCLVYESTDSLQVEQADLAIQSGQLLKRPSKASQGFSTSYFWISFTLDPSATKEEWIIELDNPHIDQIALYQSTTSHPEWQKIGYGGDRGRTFQERSYINRRYIFPLSNQTEVTRYLMMVDKRNASVSFPLKLWEKEAFLHEEESQQIIYGIYFGMLFFVCFVSLIFGSLIRQRLLIMYGAYALMMVLYLFTALGYSFQYIYPSSGVINNYSRVLLIVFISCLSTLFSRDFLKLDQYTPSISRIFRWINYSLIALFVTWLFFTGLFRIYTIWVLNIIYVLMMGIFVLSFAAAIKTYRFNKTYSITYLSAFSSLILGCLAYMGVEYGLIQESFFPLHPVLMGSGLEILILSYSMLAWTKDIIFAKKHLEVQHQSLSVQYDTLSENERQLKQQIETIQQKEQAQNERLDDTLPIKSQRTVLIKQITHIVADGHYLEIYQTEDSKPIIERMTLKEVVDALPDFFLRIHRSYIVNSDHVISYRATHIELKNGIQLPLSRSYKNKVIDKLKARLGS